MENERRVSTFECELPNTQTWADIEIDTYSFVYIYAAESNSITALFHWLRDNNEMQLVASVMVRHAWQLLSGRPSEQVKNAALDYLVTQKFLVVDSAGIYKLGGAEHGRD